jgi:uncharacterized protein (TIGR02757 family)
MCNTNTKSLQKNKIKKILDHYAKLYDTQDFIKNDPVKFIHQYNDKRNIEIAGFIASMFAYGKRELFIKKLETFLTRDKNLYNFVNNFDEKDELLANFDYRFSKGIDFIQILKIIQKIQRENETLETLFQYNYERNHSIIEMLQGVTDYFYANVTMNVTQGFYHLLPNPQKGGAMKRMNMMLRWFVRKSAVDRGIWSFIQPKELIIPLDVHVGNISRAIGLLSKKNNNMKSALEITERLKEFDPKDPIKYDFALFGIGINGTKDFLED